MYRIKFSVVGCDGKTHTTTYPDYFKNKDDANKVISILKKYYPNDYTFKVEMEKYIVITWPESQELFDMEGFKDNCHLINDDKGLDKFGSSAYFVNEDWYNNIMDKLNIK